jgi:hypothetical protein
VPLAQSRRSNLNGVVGHLSLALTVAVFVIGLAGCGGDDGEGAGSAPIDPILEDQGPVHVHGLGVNPADGALLIATHTGLFRAPEGEQRATRVGDRLQDTMGFTVVGPDRFLGSGHPDGRDDLPPFLGLIETRDAGRSWEPISLQGAADFHVLEAAGQRVYGFGSDFESRQEQLLVSDDGGGSWEERSVPESLISLAIDPEDSDHVVASSESQLYVSQDGGRGWRPLGAQGGLLAWTDDGALHLVDRNGQVQMSEDGGSSWKRGGETGGQPAAFDNAVADLYVALHDGTVKKSSDHGQSWKLRSRP